MRRPDRLLANYPSPIEELNCLHIRVEVFRQAIVDGRRTQAELA